MNTRNETLKASEMVGDFPFSIYQTPTENELVVMDLDTLKRLKKEIFNTIWDYLHNRLKVIFEQNDCKEVETESFQISKQYDDLSGATTIYYKGELVFDRGTIFAKQGEWLKELNSLYLQFLYIRDEKAALAAAQEKIKLINQILGEKEDVNQW